MVFASISLVDYVTVDQVRFEHKKFEIEEDSQVLEEQLKMKEDIVDVAVGSKSAKTESTSTTKTTVSSLRHTDIRMNFVRQTVSYMESICVEEQLVQVFCEQVLIMKDLNRRFMTTTIFCAFHR